jgi:hypothetical protein
MITQAPMWILVAVTPLLWAAGILLMRIVGIPSNTMPFFVAVGSVLPSLVFTTFVTKEFGSLGSRSVAIALIAGVLNGSGLILFWGGLVGGASRGLWELSRIGPLTYALLPSFLAVGGWLFLGARFSVSRLGGVACAAAAIMLLSRK